MSYRPFRVILHGRVASRHNLVRGHDNYSMRIFVCYAIHRQLALGALPSCLCHKTLGLGLMLYLLHTVHTCMGRVLYVGGV